MVNCCAANKCYPCPTTFLLPISPAAHTLMRWANGADLLAIDLLKKALTYLAKLCPPRVHKNDKTVP
jgi:hypothetical protein